jgi:hypothetical protein
MVALLAIGGATLASSNLARGDDDPPAAPSAAPADEGARPAAGPAEEQRSTSGDPKAGETQDAATEGSVPTVQMVNPNDSQVVCKYYKPLGTRIQKRVCATVKEWGERAARDRKDVDDFARAAREASSQPPPAGTTPGRTPF